KLLGVAEARIEDHPLPRLLARGVPVTMATDDPAMFHTTLDDTYIEARQTLGLSLQQLVSLAEAGFRFAFLPEEEKQSKLNQFRSEVERLGLL
ncbi:MAG TPA: hypothetical protein VGS15_05465, partial [Candidatus Acidoferrales bacterium]|nr:hypothetical protein [Candidatus Acidoferrales bacterium]